MSAIHAQFQNDIANLIPVQPSDKKGVSFRSITPLLQSVRFRDDAFEMLTIMVKQHDPTNVFAIDSRGYILGGVIADRLKISVTMVAKKGKLPGDIFYSEPYKTEYNAQDGLEVSKQAVQQGDRVVIVDDILASGNTAITAAELAVQAGAEIVAFAFLGEVRAANGCKNISEKFPQIPVYCACCFKDTVKPAPEKKDELMHCDCNFVFI
jgi:adenine phosphoribosyltransferase